MIAFNDFDAWGEAVSGASLRLVCDAVETPTWTLGILDLDGVLLQMASEGGGNICYGANTHDGPILFVPLTHASEHIVNGTWLDEDSLLAIPRGSDFSIRVRRRAHSWCSVALPADGVDLGAWRTGSRRIACAPGSVARLRGIVRLISESLENVPAGTPAHSRAGRELVAAAQACLSAPLPSPQRSGRPRLDRTTIIRRSMAAIDDTVSMPSAAELARHAGVTGRTLLRAFQETFGTSPKQYLMLRELHRIRRILCAGATADTTVADVLASNGIWEFGRFAGRYRRQFGELPAETLRRSRG